jgi:hypothetical protein
MDEVLIVLKALKNLDKLEHDIKPCDYIDRRETLVACLEHALWQQFDKRGR